MTALVFFYDVVDIIANYQKLPSSSNLQVLYIYYITLYSADIFYPLALIFSFLMTIYSMVKFNEIVSFYSLGIGVKKLLKPFISFALLVFTVFFALQFTKFPYMRQYADNLLSHKKLTDKNLFLKWQNKVIYIQKLNPVLKEAFNMRVFYLKNSKVEKIVIANKAVFSQNEWIVKNATVKYLKENEVVVKKENLKILKDFKPKIISNLKNLNSISIYDAYLAITLFKDVNVNTLLSIVFFKIFSALSLILLIVVLMFNAPLHVRISNISLFMVKSLLFTIFLWGSELMLYKFAKQNVINPYVLMLPFFIILLVELIIVYKEK
jgi:lipopolysaccharide export system permease protein